MTVLDELRRCHLCTQLDDSELAALNEIISVRSLTKGEILFIQGDAATGFFVLLSGRVRVYKASPDGKEYTLHLIRPGQMFAEVVLFEGDQYPANCAAMEESRVAFFPKGPFLALLERSPRISLKMIGGLSSFVREFNQMVEDLSLKEVPSRLASYLLGEREQTGSDSLSLDISKSELARSLGTVPETLSRNLKRLAELGVISVGGKSIVILDLSRLRSIAEGERI